MKSAEEGTIVMMLGLYLIVLAFFILLNAISETSEERAEKVKESISNGFGFQMDGMMRMRDQVQTLQNPMVDFITREVESLIESYLAVQHFKIVQIGETMRLQIAMDQVFDPGEMRIKPSQVRLFSDLAFLIKKDRPGTEVITDILVEGSRSDLGASASSVQNFLGRRASLLVRAIIEKGGRKKNISAQAVENKKESSINLIFHIHILDRKQAERALGL